MKKRIRKKLHLKEFAVFGFELHIHAEAQGEAEQDILAERIIQLVRDFHWECYGSLGQLFVFESRPGQKIAERKEQFVAALRQIPSVGEVHAHDVIDAWNGPAIDFGCECCPQH